MNGVSEDEIAKRIDKACDVLNGLRYDVLDTFFNEEHKNPNLPENESNKGVYFLSKSLKSMSQCKLVYFCKGWKDARGCKIEHDVATAYGLDVKYEQ